MTPAAEPLRHPAAEPLRHPAAEPLCHPAADHEPAAGRPEAVLAGGVAPATDFVACYQEHYGSVLRALRLAGAGPAVAEDLTQEAFARALARWGRVSRGTNPAGYVYLTAFRLLRRADRGRWRVTRATTAAATGSTDGDATTSVAVEAALSKMTPRRRECAVLCLVLGFSPAEAGEQLGIAAGTVRKHLDEGRAALQAACNPG